MVNYVKHVINDPNDNDNVYFIPSFKNLQVIKVCAEFKKQ